MQSAPSAVQIRSDSREDAMRGTGNRRIADVIRILVLLVALSVLLYPTVSNYLYEKNSSRAVANYDEKLKGITEQEYARMLQEAREYNAALIGNSEIYDPFSGESGEFHVHAVCTHPGRIHVQCGHGCDAQHDLCGGS